MNWIATKLACFLLRRTNLSVENRSLLTACLLDRLGALPFRDIIQRNENEMLVNGVPLDYETARALNESAKAALNNSALKVVWDSVAFLAVNNGIHKAETERQIFWARAALWWGQQERTILEELAQ
jgi:hypothetical protein